MVRDFLESESTNSVPQLAIVAVTHHHKFSTTTTQIYYLYSSLRSKLQWAQLGLCFVPYSTKVSPSVGLRSFLGACWGGFLAHSDCWRNLVPYRFRTVLPFLCQLPFEAGSQLRKALAFLGLWDPSICRASSARLGPSIPWISPFSLITSF